LEAAEIETDKTEERKNGCLLLQIIEHAFYKGHKKANTLKSS
jgi:hypothetical protein